jgi:hypothetical protein
MNRSTAKTPAHLWIVGVLSLLWNAVGAFDYTATQYRIESYMSQFTPEQLDYFYAFPAWADAAWAVGVWGSLFGSIFLLARKALAAWLLGAAILGLAGTSVYNFLLTDGASMMGEGAVMFTAVIWAIALFLYFYASAMARRRVIS